MGAQDWLTDEGKKLLSKETHALARRPWRSTSVRLDDPHRARMDSASMDLCSLIKTYSIEQVESLLNHTEDIKHFFYIEIWSSPTRILSQFISLDSLEVQKIRHDTLVLNSCTAIFLDKTNRAINVDLDSLFVSKTRADRLLVSLVVSGPEKNNHVLHNSDQNPLSNEERVLTKRLKMRWKENIKDFNPSCNRKRAGEPYALIIKVMCAMIDLKYPLEKITYGSVKEFIEEHINNNYDLKSLARLEEIDDFVLIVGNVTVETQNLQDRVGEYKREIFSTYISIT